MATLTKSLYPISENMMVSNRVSRLGPCTVGQFDNSKSKCTKITKRAFYMMQSLISTVLNGRYNYIW